MSKRDDLKYAERYSKGSNVRHKESQREIMEAMSETDERAQVEREVAEELAPSLGWNPALLRLWFRGEYSPPELTFTAEAKVLWIALISSRLREKRSWEMIKTLNETITLLREREKQAREKAIEDCKAVVRQHNCPAYCFKCDSTAKECGCQPDVFERAVAETSAALDALREGER